MVVYALIAEGLALALLVVIYVRAAKRQEGLQAEVDRLRVVQRDMSSDVRVRLEEGEKARAFVEDDVRPRLARLEPSVAGLSASLQKTEGSLRVTEDALRKTEGSLRKTENSLQETLPALGEARSRLEAVESRVAAAEEELRAAVESGALKASARAERIESAVRTLRNAADERLADLSARLGALEAQGPKTEREASAAARAQDDTAERAHEDTQSSAPEPVHAPAGAADENSDEERGTPAPEEHPDGRWVFVLLVVVAGVALAISALA